MIVRRMICYQERLPAIGGGPMVNTGRILEEIECEANSFEDGVKKAFGCEVKKLENLDSLEVGDIFFEVKARRTVIESRYYAEVK